MYNAFQNISVYLQSFFTVGKIEKSAFVYGNHFGCLHVYIGGSVPPCEELMHSHFNPAVERKSNGTGRAAFYFLYSKRYNEINELIDAEERLSQVCDK